MAMYGLPYMGSKDKIVQSIAANFPAAENFYDLFGGGGSVTHFMIKNRSHKYKHFYYNEINSLVAKLFQEACSGKYSYDKFKPEWISREKFFELKDKDAYVALCWSFGNNQKGYMFGKDIEPYKRSMHQAVVFEEFDDLAFKVFGFNKWPDIAQTIPRRRFYLRQKIEHFRKTKFPDFLKQYLNAKSLDRLEQLQQLDRLQQLQQLQQLEPVVTSLDYREVEIKPNSVVYCDIPYIGTADYLHSFDHKAFYDWAASRPFPVFVSEYRLDDDRFRCVYGLEKRSLLSSDKSVGNKMEKLFWNGVTVEGKKTW